MRNFFKRIFKNNSTSSPASQAFANLGLVIFSEGSAYWNTFKPIIEALSRRNAHFSYITLDKNDPAFEIDSQFMKCVFLGRPSFAYAKFIMQKANVMLSTTPNIGTKGYPLQRPQLVKCLAHVFHSVADGSYYHKGSLDNYDVVLMVGDFAERGIREIEASRGLQRKICLAMGLPYLDELAKKVVQQETEKNKENRQTILLAPSWGQKSFLSAYGHEWIRYLAERDYSIIIRPHPQSKISEADMLEKMRDAFSSHKNIYFDDAIDGSASLAAADVLVSDNSSIRFDYAFTYCRPVITLEVPKQSLDAYEWSAMRYHWDAEVEKSLGDSIAWGDYSSTEIGPKLHDCLTRVKQLDPPSIMRLRDRYIANYRRSGEAIAEWAIETCLAMKNEK